jgi:phosphatidylserine decarboxylase
VWREIFFASKIGKQENTTMMQHQYIHRDSGRIIDESLIADSWVQLLYGNAREKAPFVFKALTSAWSSQWLGYMHFDLPLHRRPAKIRKIIDALGIDMGECVALPEDLDSARKLFERQIQYWRCRPMPDSAHCVVAPSDSKALVGDLHDNCGLFVKEKFFSYEEMLGPWQQRWLSSFSGGRYAVFRLTPEKYHYNHTPVSGKVVDLYTIEGDYHSCNPGAVVTAVTPYSKNKRVVTIIDTDLPGGTGVGLVAMVEVVALMIGKIVQCYSARRYDSPQCVQQGLFLCKGQPKSLFRPGSSVVVLFFQKERMAFDADLLANCRRSGVHSRFSQGFKQPLVETEVQVRSSIGVKV